MRAKGAVLLAAAMMTGLGVWATSGGPSSTHARPSSSSSLLPRGARGLVSRALGREDPRFAARPTREGFATTPNGQAPAASFTTAGASLDGVVLGLRAIGYGDALQPLSEVAPLARGNRITYAHGAVREWFDNGPLGLEQGFTLAAPPSAARTGALTLAVGTLEPSITARIENGGRDAAILRRGTTMWRYSGLSATDRSGRSLPARLQLSGRSVEIAVDDRGAMYPITVDPFLEVAKLTPALQSAFINAVAISGDTIVAGDPNSAQARAYVFQRQPGHPWADAHETATLSPNDGALNDGFGTAVAIDGDTIVVGAPNGVTPGANTGGAAYVFTRSGGVWSQAAHLFESDPHALGNFGAAVAVSGDSVVVGAPQWAGPCTASVGGCTGGKVYVYVKPAAGWSNVFETAGLRCANPAALADGGRVGQAVAISGDTVYAGSPSWSQVCVFSKGAGSWTSTETPSSVMTGTGGDHVGFGSSIGADGNTVVVGAQGDAARNAYVFVGGVQQAVLGTSDGAPRFPVAVAVYGRVIVAGGTDANLNGKVYEYTEPPFGWSNSNETQILSPSDSHPNDFFGHWVAISGAAIVAFGNGAEHVFTVPTDVSVGCNPDTFQVGTPTTCSATVIDSTAARTPTGNVQFAALVQGGQQLDLGQCTLAQTAIGTASCQISYTPTSAGTQVAGGLYIGDGGHQPGTSNLVQLTVAPVSTTTTLECQPATVAVGKPTTCTATVSPTTGSATGQVSFTSEGAGTFSGGGTCTLAGGACHVTYTPSTVGSGSHKVTASYEGDAANATSSASATASVTKAASASTIACAPQSVAVGQTATCTVTVTQVPGGTPTPKGTVSVTSDSSGSFGTGPTGSCALTATATPGAASCHVGYTPSAFGSGTHTLATAYPGDAEHTASAGHGTVSVIPPGPTGPVLSGVRLAQRKFRAKAGTTLSFTLNEPATVTGAITRTVRGHKVHGHCRVKARHGRRCSLVVPAGRATFAGVAGANSARFRLSRLRAGRYQMTAIARDAAGQTSPPVMIRFTVTKPRRRH